MLDFPGALGMKRSRELHAARLQVEVKVKAAASSTTSVGVRTLDLALGRRTLYYYVDNRLPPEYHKPHAPFLIHS